MVSRFVTDINVTPHRPTTLLRREEDVLRVPLEAWLDANVEARLAENGIRVQPPLHGKGDRRKSPFPAQARLSAFEAT